MILINGEGKLMYVIIDRFEDEYAVVEMPDKKMLNIEKNKIPPEAKEGDVLKIENDKIFIDEIETIKRKMEIEKMMNDIWK